MVHLPLPHLKVYSFGTDGKELYRDVQDLIQLSLIHIFITMKKNAIIYIDDTHAQVTKAFEKQARIFGTPEYREWRAYRQDFPTAQMVTKTIKKNTSKRTYKNLTYVNMERFLNMQPNGKALIKEFNDQKETCLLYTSTPWRMQKQSLRRFLI